MLKTDYKNAMWEGAKKYRITSNPDGTLTIVSISLSINLQ